MLLLDICIDLGAARKQLNNVNTKHNTIIPFQIKWKRLHFRGLSIGNMWGKKIAQKMAHNTSTNVTDVTHKHTHTHTCNAMQCSSHNQKLFMGMRGGSFINNIHRAEGLKKYPRRSLEPTFLCAAASRGEDEEDRKDENPGPYVRSPAHHYRSVHSSLQSECILLASGPRLDRSVRVASRNT